MAKTVGPGGHVLAFEPQRIVFQILCANVALNSLTNVYAYDNAVGEAMGRVSIPPIRYEKEGNFGGVALIEGNQGEGVSVLSLDTLDLEVCHFIKIDIEGMESFALRGARQTIKKCKPILYVENDRPEKSNELIELLRSMDYRIYRHLPPLFNPKNFFKCPHNIFEKIVSMNVLCIPIGSSISVTTLEEIDALEEHSISGKSLQEDGGRWATRTAG